MLEWYRPGFTYLSLIAEVEEVLCLLLGRDDSRRISYRDAFRRFAGFDPMQADLGDLRGSCRDRGWLEASNAERDACLDFLLDASVQGGLGSGVVTIFDFPASQSSLARLKPDDPGIAERFEVFVDGIEVGNGYRELTDAGEQRERLEQDRRKRRRMGLPDTPVDHRLVAALRAGMPECSGVALGLDRIVMIATGHTRVAEVISFSFAGA
jgi:lysyl-tRNA synthetase class 2